MSKFVLTAQLQLQAPTNVPQIVSQIQNQLNNVSVNVQVKGSAQANQQIQQITQSTKAAKTAADRMGRAFAVSIRRFAAFSIATRAVGLFTSTLSEAVQTAIDFERELIKISQVTGRSVSSLRDLTDSVTNLSTNLGVTSQSLLEVTTVLTQAGLSSDDTKIALESLAKAALAPNFDSIQETAEGAIAILAQFKQGVGALEGQLSSIDAVAGAFAVEASDLIDVIRRSGGVFKASGGSLNELLALFTSVRATTRESAESIGTGLRTIFTRIQRPETIEFLKQFGIELVDLNGKFVGPFEAIKRLSEALSGLGEGDLTFIRVAEELGGFRQIGKVLPLLQQFSTAQAALNVAQTAGNGLTKNAETAQAALAIRIIKVREEFLALIRSMTETPTFQIMANAALSLASALIKIADSIKPLLPLLGAVAAFRAVKGIGGFLGGIGAGLTSGKTFNAGGKVQAFATGGLVPGSGNRDTVPAMLTPGEFVIRKSSVQKLGASNLKQMNTGGSVSHFAVGGKASRKVDYEKGVAPSPFASAKSNKLGQEVYALQKSSGLSQFEFDDAKRFADANGYNLQQFKTLIAKRAQDKKNKAGLKTNTSDLLSTLRGEPTQATERQTSLARQLSGPEASAQPKTLSPEAEKLRVMLGGTPRKFAAGGRAIVGATSKLKSTQKRDTKYSKPKDVAGSGNIQFDVNPGEIGAFVLSPPKGSEGGYSASQPYQFTLPAKNKYAQVAASQAGLSIEDIKGGVNAVINPATYPVFFPGLTEGRANLANNAKYASAVHKGFLDGIATGVNSTISSVSSQGLLDLPPAFNTNEQLLASTISKIQSDNQVRSSIEGYLFEGMISAFTGASAAGGRANFDFPRSAISQNKEKLAALFGSGQQINKLIKAEAKRSYDEVGGNIQRKLANDIIAGYKGGVTLKTSLKKQPTNKHFGGIIQKFAVGGKADPKDTLEQYFADSTPFNLGLSNSRSLNKDQRKQLASNVKNMRQLRSQAPAQVYSSLSRNAFNKFASDTGLNKNPDIPEGTKLFDKAKYYSQAVTKIVGRSFSLPGFVSTSKEFGKAKMFLDNAPRDDDRWGAMLTINTKKNAQGVDVEQQLSGRKLNITKQDINPRTGKMETFFMQPPSAEKEVVLSPRSRFKVTSAKFVDLMGNKNVWADAQQFASGGLVPGVGNSDTVPATLQQGDFVIRKSSVAKLGVENLASMSGYAAGGNVGKSVPALLTPGEWVVGKDQAQSIGYGNLNRMNKVGKFAQGGVVQRFATGTATGGAKPIISNIPVPGFDTKAPTLLNQIVGKLTGTFSILDLNLKQSSNQFKLLQTITPDLSKALMDYANASNLNVKQTGQLAGAYSKLVGTMLMQGDKDSQIVASMQPYVDALKADTNAKLNSAKATVAMSPINAAASKFPSLTQPVSPQQTGTFPQLVNKPAPQQASASASTTATSANTTAVASNTQAQKSAAQSAMGVVTNNKMFAASMATSLIGGFLPAVDENSGAIVRVTQSLFSMTTAIFGTLAALEAMNISLNKQTLSNVLDLLTGKGGNIASSVGKFAGNALGGTKVGGMIAPMGNLGGGLGAKAVQTTITQTVTAIGGIVGPLIGATAAFFAIQAAGNSLTEAFMNYETRLKKAKETGNVEGARKIATEQQSSKTAVNVAAGSVSGAIIGTLLTPILGPLGPQLGAAVGGIVAKSLSDLPEYSGQVAATQASLIKAQDSLTKASENAGKALSDFQQGSISAAEFVKSTSGAANNVAAAKAESNKLNEQSQKEISREGDFGGLRGGLRNVFTLGGLIGESTVEKQARIESEQQKSRADVSKQEKELINTSQPALNALSGEIAAAGGTFNDVLNQIEATNPSLYFALLSQGSGELSKSFDNIKKEVERAQKAFNAINLGMQNVQGAAAAAALGVNNYIASQQAGNVGLEQSLAVLEASVTSAAQGISDADFGKALNDAESTLRGFGASDQQVDKFRGNISAVNEVQKNQSSIFADTKDQLAADIRKSNSADQRKKVFSDTIAKRLESQKNADGTNKYSAETIQRFRDASANMSDDQLKKIGEGDFSAFEESINELGKKTMEQVNGPLKAAIEIQRQLNDLTKQRIEAERQLMNAQLEASNVRMEAMDIAAKYGGPKVTPAMRAQNVVQQANIQSQGITGVTDLKTGSAQELSQRTQQLSTRQAEISAIRMRAAQGDAGAQQQLQGESGLKLQEEEKKLQDAAKSQIQATRDLIKSKEEELRIIKEKNQLERSSIDALVSGDIEKFFDQQAAVGAQAAIATGDQRMIRQFGMSALGAAAQETRRQQEAGVTELYGQQLSGPGGLTERAYGSAISAAGIQNPLAMAQVAAGSTGTEAAIESDIRDLAATMGPAADVQTQAAQGQLLAAKMQYDAAKARGEEAVTQMQARQAPGMATGGVVYANRGIFVPRGTDTVPAMLTPGEFVVNRAAVQRGNNLQILQAMNKGASPSAPAASSQSGDVATMASGGLVRYRSGGSTGPEAGGMGISAESLSAFASALSQFNTELTKNIQTLASTKFEITLNPTNINVNLTGTSFLSNLAANIKQDLIKFLGEEISNYSVGNDGKLRKTGSTLGTIT